MSEYRKQSCGCGATWEGLKTSSCPRCSSFAAPSGYTAAQQLDMLCEILRNVNNGVMHINAANFDHAALDLEVAASKLRTLQKEKAV